MDDTFAMFKKEIDCDMFLNQVNSLHAFAHEMEVEGKLSFLNVLVEKTSTEFLTSVYRKPSFMEQYIRWDSFGPKSRKPIQLVRLYT